MEEFLPLQFGSDGRRLRPGAEIPQRHVHQSVSGCRENGEGAVGRRGTQGWWWYGQAGVHGDPPSWEIMRVFLTSLSTENRPNLAGK